VQPRTTKLRVDAPEEQLSLIPARKPSRPVNLEHITVLKNTKHALEYACQLADLAPKEIYVDMGCEKSVWSRICGGDLDLDGRDIPRFNRVVGNSAYLLYLMHADGWDLTSLRKVQDDKDREIAELRKHIADQDRAIRLMVEYQKGRG